MAYHYVYFIQAGQNGPIKIGHSWNIAARLLTLQQATVEELYHIGDTHCANRREALALEYKLHQRLKDYHIRGEWFQPAPQVLAEVPASCGTMHVLEAVAPTRQIQSSPFTNPFWGFIPAHLIKVREEEAKQSPLRLP